MLLLILLVGIQKIGSAQKKIIDFNTPDSWPIISGQSISGDGKYVSYKLGSQAAGYSLIVQNIDKSWKKELKNANNAFFTEDSKFLGFKKAKDSVGIIDLANDRLRYIKEVGSFAMPKDGDGKWLAYQLKNVTKDLILLNLATGKEQVFHGVKKYLFNNDGSVLLITSPSTKNEQNESLTWYNLKTGEGKIISENHNLNNFAFDKKGKQLAYLTTENIEDSEYYKMWYYKENQDSAIVKVNTQTSGMNGMQIENSMPYFSRNGQKVFFFIKYPLIKKPVELDTRASVYIWNYRIALTESLKSKNYPLDDSPYDAVIDVESKSKVVRLKYQDDRRLIVSESSSDYVIAKKQNKKIIEPNQNEGDIFIVSTKDGSRKLVARNAVDYSYSLGFSLLGKYIIWYSPNDKQWFAYNIAAAKLKNISQQINTHLYINGYDHADSPPECGLGGWLKDDKAVLIYDNYDIWQVDPEGIKNPVNITRSYGKKNKIMLRIVWPNNNVNSKSSKLPDTLLLSAFNKITKKSGFFSLLIREGAKLNLLTMGNYAWYFEHLNGNMLVENSYNSLPVKAKNDNCYLLYRMNANEYPNVIATKNFKDFIQLTDLHPQSEYNWYKNELIHWKLPNGGIGEGILYKPENFNANKRYPVIFFYYEKNADGLNLFLTPEYSRGTFSIPWYTSNGYLVCVPDIYYKVGYPGESAYQSVTSAAKFLSSKPWVDSQKLALQGHSFGGFETNYIITRTNIFCAAASSSGLNEFISGYNEAIDGVDTRHAFYKAGQLRIGASLWQRPDLYIKNSPIFSANKITTPLLIMHGSRDYNVKYNTQGLAWFIALQSLGKKAWMLEYDEGHTIRDKKNQKDYTIRQTQFFDYYLKNKPAPLWMLTDSSNTNSLKLDINGRKP